jgi:enoyl-CoA hydratase/carnithine racemase
MPSSHEYDTVRYEVRDRTAIITLNRPDRLNAIIPQLRLDTVTAFREAEQDDEVQTIVLTGAGRGFCAGRDLKAPENSPESEMTAEHAAVGSDFPLILREVLKPVIAAVNGPARGAGTNLVFAADFRIFSERANLAVNFIERGIVAEYALFFLSRLIGLHRATEICMLGDVFDAHQAADWGLTHRLVPHDELMDAAMDLARRLSARAPLAVQETKAEVNRVHYVTSEEFTAMQTEANNRLRQTEDWTEGIQAFREKRSPNFRGR